MSERNCPRCGIHLNSYNYYFCSNCGQKLEDQFIRPFSIAKNIRYQAPKGVASQRITGLQKTLSHWLSLPNMKRNIFLSVVAFLLTANVVFFILIYYKPQQYLPFLRGGNANVKVETPNANTLNLKMAAMPAPFSTQTLASYVPKDSVLYIESISYNYFVDKFFIDNSPYADQLQASRNLVSDSFAFFVVKINDAWEAGGIFIPQDITTIEEDLEKVQNDKLVLEVVDGNVIAATNQNVIEQVKEVRSKTVMSLFQNPGFATSNAKLAREGVVKIIMLDKNVQDLANIAGDYAPAVKPILEAVVSSGYTEMVIL